MAQVECPRCRGKIDPRATRCQHCQVDFTDADLAAIQDVQGNRRGIVLVAGLAALMILIVSQCELSPPSSASSSTGQATNALKAPGQDIERTDERLEPVEKEPASEWSYSRTMDELRNREIVKATIRSANSTTLDFPYGTVHLNITVRQHPQWGRDVVFYVDEGQILCRIRDCSGMISFDGKSEKLTLVESADNDSSVVFAAYAPAITRKLQNADKVIVELPFFQNGNRQFTFNTTGLEWPPKKQ